MTITSIPPTFYQVAFNAPPNQSALPPWWTDISNRVQFESDTERGRQYELDQNETGEWRTSLANPDGALDPSNTASPFAPNIVPYRQYRIKVIPGANLLSPDQATCGQARGYPAGQVPAQMGVVNDYGYPLALAASATAYTGTQVYQAALPSGAGTFATVLILPVVRVVPATAYAFSAQVRVDTAGQNLPLNAAILWYNAAGVNVSAVGGTAATITGGSSAWTSLSVAATVPAGAVRAALKVELTSVSPTAQTLVEVGALQFEQSATATTWQAPNTVPINLLPRAIATGSASISPTTDTVTNWFTLDSGGSIAQANFIAPAPTGHTTAVAWTSAAGTNSNFHLYAGTAAPGASAVGAVADCVQVTAGVQYTASVYLSRLATADATVQITVSYRWFDVNGNLLATSAGTPVTVPTSGWVRGTCTATAPAGAAWGRPRIYISAPASTTAVNTVYTTGWQVEAAAAASVWVDPGNTYQIINGFIERWPQTWSELNGTYGTSDIVGPDQLTALAQYTLADPFIEEVNALGPNFFYTLSDPAGAVSCADASGNRPPAPVENSPYGPGSLTFGASATSTSIAGGAQGTSGTCAAFANPSGVLTSPETYISLHKATLTPGPPVGGNWTRIIHFNCTAAPIGGNSYVLWESLPGTYIVSNNTIDMGIASLGTGALYAAMVGSSGSIYTYTGTVNVCDGNWHQYLVTCTSTGAVSLYLDGVRVSTGSITLPMVQATSDVVGASVHLGSQQFGSGLSGSVANIIEFPTVLTQAQITNLYNSFRTGSSGESTGARINRILSWIGWEGPTAIANGATPSMGPATDLAGDAALDAINAVVITENGNFYASNQGVLTFQARNARYNQNVPAYIFGESATAGEWPFEILYFDDDPSHIANNVQITQYNAATYTVIDEASTMAYFPRVYQRTVNSSSVNECIDAANYLVSQYKDTGLRIEQLRLHPSAVPGLFNVCLNLEIGTRIRVNRRPTGAPTITFDGFVEKVAWTWDPDTGDVFVDLQCSPANKTNYWVLGATHTTLSTPANAGTNTISIRALPDSAVNALRSSLPTGATLMIDPGTAAAETVIVAPGGIPATNPGYSAATLTLTANLANNHGSGAVVCDVLPTGASDPTAYDAQSVLGATGATLAAAAASGAASITVAALSDSKLNALSSDWNVGAQLQIGTGASLEGYNLLSPNVSTAGEGVFALAPGTSGTVVGLVGAAGTPVVAASATAFQGAQVWQTAVAANLATPSGVLFVNRVNGTAGLAYTASAYMRSVTSGANPQVYIYVEYLSATGSNLGSTASSPVTLTGSPTAAWTRASITATAPAGTVWIQVGIVVTGTAPSVAWSWQGDGLQLEQSPSPSAYQTCPQIKAIATTYPGYSTCVITLASPLVNNHQVGEQVCDVLPPGDTSPSQVAATAIAAY